MRRGDDAESAEDFGTGGEHEGILGGADQDSFGSSASRSPSPRRLKPSTARKMAAPGATDIQGACSMKFLATWSIWPQDGEGGCWPRPRKERAASRMIACAMNSVDCTTIGGSVFGATWRNRMTESRTPTARAPSTKSSVLTLITWPR